MMITSLAVRFEHNNQQHEACLHFNKKRASGIREQVGTDDVRWTLLNATPEETLQEVKAKYGIDLISRLDIQVNILRHE